MPTIAFVLMGVKQEFKNTAKYVVGGTKFTLVNKLSTMRSKDIHVTVWYEQTYIYIYFHYESCSHS